MSFEKTFLATFFVILAARAAVAQTQLDAPQFEDLRRKDWYEDLKHQERIKAESESKIAWIENQQKQGCRGSIEMCTALKSEQDALMPLYRSLSDMASKILIAKTYEEYSKLKSEQGTVLSQIETQKIRDHTDVLRFELHISERDAEILQLEQSYMEFTDLK